MSLSELRSQSEINRQNAIFWNELCGSHAARVLGVTGNDPISLKKFDDWFFDFYPYVEKYVPFSDLNGKHVLEVGLGYGSLSQRIVEAGANFTGLDIAPGPVAGVNHRILQSGLGGRAVEGSILDAPFPDGSFDFVVSIGCFHHTGDMERALAEAARILRPGGDIMIMTYNAASYYRWLREPGRTAKYVFSVMTGNPKPLPFQNNSERGRYDANEKGEAAPETVLVSKTHFARMLRRHFAEVRVNTENAVAIRPFSRVPRNTWLKTVGRIAGLDLYARGCKPTTERNLL